MGTTMRLLAFLLALLAVGLAEAQNTFTERLQAQAPHQGVVVLHQDAEIDALVNGLAPKTGTLASKDLDTLSLRGKADKLLSDSLTNPSLYGKKVRMDGFRIQVYVGGNSRDAKTKAQQMEGKVRSYYPDVDIYTRFVSPRWICHVGDFKTRDEASEFLRDLRAKGGFSDAIIVKCKINAYAY